ncbi:hypothetical protein [Bacteroides uniformis]|uniref:Uncharacterized protein n=1 Tax=Bacteroides uniformis TaxID=820 RepID=A0A1Y3UV13_BACUN|nr:hypothetical protein [Bacteroides uniformis]OUN52671.1 hypothetical protein B5G17_16520 [Bacteroides uniformis]
MKYRGAISLYLGSSLSIKQICEQTGVGFSAFSSYLSTHHRDLILKRHNLTEFKNVKLRGKKGQTTAAHYKYKDAIAACDSMEYIEYNISQIARIFNVDCSSLASQLRRHYPDIVPHREQERRRIGITVNLQYGARKWSKEEYATAIEMLQSSDKTIEEVAEACNVSYTGLREHILAYYPQITRNREEKRIRAIGQKVRGLRNGNWTVCEPGRETLEKYEKAIDLYRTTSKDVKDIVRIVGVTLGGFRYHLRTWYPELMVLRRGFDEGMALEQTKRYKKSSAEKYANAIERLQNTDLPTAKVAAEFGLNPETFRMYLREHHPELVTARGMIRTSDGKVVSNRSAEKYAEALRIYATTSESLKSIAKRLGLTYNSVGGFIRRNYPEAIKKHNALLTSSCDKFKEGISILKDSNLSINAIMEEFGYNESFRIYVKANHPELLEKKATRRCVRTKVATDKYAAAIEHLRTSSDTMKDVAAKFGLNLSSFRKYLYKHATDVLAMHREQNREKINPTI